MIIYLDIDDVVADWHEAAQVFLKRRWDKTGERIPHDEWERIKDNSRFYRDLPLREGANELVAWCKAYADTNPGTEVRFLTAIPKGNDMPWAVQDKVWWAHEHFPGIPLFIGPYSHDKHVHCQPGDILIDDRTSNCEEWIAAGGKSHIYRHWSECQKWLEDTLIYGKQIS
jgi:5'(3')-deoxyribonucleotidase